MDPAREQRLLQLELARTRLDMAMQQLTDALKRRDHSACERAMLDARDALAVTLGSATLLLLARRQSNGRRSIE